jgi:hypothetical protein
MERRHFIFNIKVFPSRSKSFEQLPSGALQTLMCGYWYHDLQEFLTNSGVVDPCKRYCLNCSKLFVTCQVVLCRRPNTLAAKRLLQSHDTKCQQHGRFVKKPIFWSSKTPSVKRLVVLCKLLDGQSVVPLFQILSTNNGVLYLCKTLSVWTLRSRPIESPQVLCRLSDKRCRVYLVAMLELLRAKPPPSKALYTHHSEIIPRTPQRKARFFRKFPYVD